MSWCQQPCVPLSAWHCLALPYHSVRMIPLHPHSNRRPRPPACLFACSRQTLLGKIIATTITQCRPNYLDEHHNCSTCCAVLRLPHDHETASQSRPDQKPNAHTGCARSVTQCTCASGHRNNSSSNYHHSSRRSVPLYTNDDHWHVACVSPRLFARFCPLPSSLCSCVLNSAATEHAATKCIVPLMM